MLGFEKIITISTTTKENEAIVIESIDKIGLVSIQAVNGDLRIKYNEEETEIKSTRMFRRRDYISNMNIVALQSDIKIYVTIRYKEDIEVI